MEKITLVITSMNPDQKKLSRLLKSAKGFDDIYLHIDYGSKDGINVDTSMAASPIKQWVCLKHLEIPDAYNYLIDKVEDGWICAFCDDDYFEEEGLALMLKEIRNGDAKDYGVCTFKTFVTGYSPWRDKGSVLAEIINRYIAPPLMKKGVEVVARRWYGYKARLTPNGVLWQSNIPAGAFFRKTAWEKVHGFTGEIAHDWILWLKMIRSGIEFKYFPYIVYTYERRENSSWFRQFRDIANGSMEELRAIVNREAKI